MFLSELWDSFSKNVFIGRGEEKNTEGEIGWQNEEEDGKNEDDGDRLEQSGQGAIDGWTLLRPGGHTKNCNTDLLLTGAKTGYWAILSYLLEFSWQYSNILAHII